MSTKKTGGAVLLFNETKFDMFLSQRENEKISLDFFLNATFGFQNSMQARFPYQSKTTLVRVGLCEDNMK